MNTPRHKSDLLTNIEMLWQDAEHSADDQAKSTFNRISELMQDAMATQIVANDAVPSPHADATPASSPEQPSEHDAQISALAALVDTASHADTNGQPSPSASSQPSFDETKARMESVSQLKPPHQDSFNSNTPEYAFGAAFTDLVRHVVRDYIHNEVEDVIKNAIRSELDSHFKGDGDNTK